MSVIDFNFKIPQQAPVEKARTLQALKPILEAIQRILGFLASLHPDELKRIADQFDASITSKYPQSETDFATKLGANQISEEERGRLELAALKKHFDRRQELLKNSLTAPQVAELLGTTRQTPHDRLKKDSLVAILDNGVWKFPIWQFDPQGPDGVIDGLPDILKALDVPPYSKLCWLTRPNKALSGLTPVEALKNGKKNHVLAQARTVGVL